MKSKSGSHRLAVGSVDPAWREGLVRECLGQLLEVAGYRPEAVDHGRVAKFVDRLATRMPLQEALTQIASREPSVIRELIEVASVGETFFFRHAAQFHALASSALPAMLAEPRAVVRAWSAGCATGEEAYSLSACLRAHVPAGVAVEVLGTDLVERNITFARQAVYSPWSLRAGSPALWPVVERTAAGLCVLRELRELTHFAVHNALAPPPASWGPFDIIFCRNMLLYLAPDAVQRAIGHLRGALAKGGAVVFGVSDLLTPPLGLASRGPSDVQMFGHLGPSSSLLPRSPRRSFRPAASKATLARGQRPSAHRTPRPCLASVVRPNAKADDATETAIDLHRRALALVERADWVGAAELLARQRAIAPHYIAGLLEQALLHARHGERPEAHRLLRELLRRTASLSDDTVLPGPEALPVAYYRTAAHAHLRSRLGKREGL